MSDVNLSGIAGTTGQGGQTPGASGANGGAGGAIVATNNSSDPTNTAEAYGGAGGNGGSGANGPTDPNTGHYTGPGGGAGSGAGGGSASATAIATAVAAASAADVNPVLGANSNLNAAFGSATAELGLGELGGRHDANGANAETINSSVDLVVDPTKLSVRKDLILGLYSGTSIGSGFSSLTFNVDVGSAQGVVNQTFTSVTAAQSYFTNHAIDLGAIGTSPFDVRISLTETTTAANSGFDFGFLIGDANPYASPAAAHAMRSNASAPNNAFASALFDAAFAPSSADTGPSYAAPDSAGTLAAATGIKPAHAARVWETAAGRGGIRGGRVQCDDRLCATKAETASRLSGSRC